VTLRWTVVGVAMFLVLIISSCNEGSGQELGAEYRYNVAFVDSQLRVLHGFRTRDGERLLKIPVALSPTIFSRDGRSLYGFDRSRAGLLKLDLEDMRLSVVSGSLDLRGAAGIAISPGNERIILSGNYPLGNLMVCGIFEITSSAAKLRLIVENKDCGPQAGSAPAGLEMWSDLSLSSDGDRLLVHNRSGLQIADLVNRTLSPLPGDFSAGSWSPDGRWLAVVEASGGKRTILLDAKTLTQQRSYATSLARWSPDSRYLLAWAADLCDPYWFTFAVIDVKSGERLTVNSSKCKVNLSTAGWIEGGVLERNR